MKDLRGLTLDECLRAIDHSGVFSYPTARHEVNQRMEKQLFESEMDQSNSRPTQVASGLVGGPSMESGDWRAHLQDNMRKRIQNTLIKTFERRLPMIGHERLQDLKKIVVRFEEKVYTVATSQFDGIQRLVVWSSGGRWLVEAIVNDFDGVVAVYGPIVVAVEMDQSNLRPTQAASGLVGDPSMKSGDWRAHLQEDMRQRIQNKLIETFKRHLPMTGHEGLQEFTKVAVRFEEMVYTTATSQSDYLRKISSKMLTFVRSHPMPDLIQATNGLNPVNPVPNSETLKTCGPFWNSEETVANKPKEGGDDVNSSPLHAVGDKRKRDETSKLNETCVETKVASQAINAANEIMDIVTTQMKDLQGLTLNERLLAMSVIDTSAPLSLMFERLDDEGKIRMAQMVANGYVT
nr:hypothetical protein [Tanacetum cinerariifolium]